jgi:hypothetical protein
MNFIFNINIAILKIIDVTIDFNCIENINDFFGKNKIIGDS